MSNQQIPKSIGAALLRGPLTDDERQLLGRVRETIKGLLNTLNSLVSKLSNLDLGVPNDGTGNATTGNFRGQWVTVTITDSAQLGNGASAPVVFAHNLAVPVVPVPGRAYNHPNVEWGAARIYYGDRSGSNPAPAPGVGTNLHTSVYFCQGDPVTDSTIALRVSSDLTIDAAHPLEISFFFHPGVV